MLVGPGVEEMGEIPFLQFGQAKGLGKGRQWHLKKGQGVDEANVSHLQLQDLGPIPGLFQHPLLTVVFLHEGVSIKALKNVGQHRQGTSSFFRQVVEPRGELLEAGLALETEGVILHFGFGHHQVGDVLSVLLSIFDVEEDVEGSWGIVPPPIRDGTVVGGGTIFPPWFSLFLDCGWPGREPQPVVSIPAVPLLLPLRNLSGLFLSSRSPSSLP